MRIIFAGTPDFAASHLQSIISDSSHQILAVYTQPDRPAGRGKKLSASPVKKLAEAHGIKVLQPASLREHGQQELMADLRADLMVVVAYGLILPPNLISGIESEISTEGIDMSRYNYANKTSLSYG